MEWFNANVLTHWPFMVVMSVLWLVGHFSEHSVFTKHRATNSKPGWFWYWARESLKLHSTFTGALIGLVWADPESAGFEWYENVGYFAGAGFLALFGWLIIRAILKKFGIDSGKLVLPGDSLPPDKQDGT